MNILLDMAFLSVKKHLSRSGQNSRMLLHILLLIFSYYLYFIFTYIYICSLVLCFIFLHCPLSRPVLIYISLLIISCIIEYVTNKRTLNLGHNMQCLACNKIWIDLDKTKSHFEWQNEKQWTYLCLSRYNISRNYI